MARRPALLRMIHEIAATGYVRPDCRRHPMAKERRVYSWPATSSDHRRRSVRFVNPTSPTFLARSGWSQHLASAFEGYCTRNPLETMVRLEHAQAGLSLDGDGMRVEKASGRLPGIGTARRCGLGASAAETGGFRRRVAGRGSTCPPAGRGQIVGGSVGATVGEAARAPANGAVAFLPGGPRSAHVPQPDRLKSPEYRTALRYEHPPQAIESWAAGSVPSPE